MIVNNGYLINIQAGEDLAALDWCYIEIASGRAYKADRTDPAKKAVLLISTGVTMGEYTQGYAAGIVSDWPDTLTPGTIYYLSDTVGEMTDTKPTSGNYQVLGTALSATEFAIGMGPIIIQPLSIVTNIDFGSISDGGGLGTADISLPGAMIGDAVLLTIPDALFSNNVTFTAYIQRDNEVRVSMYNNTLSSIDYDAADFSIRVFKNNI